MKMNLYRTLFLLVLLALLAFSFKIEKDPLHNRTFNTSLSETKNNVVKKKTISDKISFKNGKLRSDFLQKKFGFKWIRYRINKDSVYVDSTDTEVQMLVIEASATDEKNQTVLLDFTTLEWDLDGEIKITRNDKPRYTYALSGREKGGKPKRLKKINEEEQDREPVFKVIMP